MYDVLIVDDEISIRKGLKILIDWNEYGYNVTGEAANGLEALNLMRDHSFHLLLADIRMPKLDGLELIKQISQMKLKTKTIIISGYKDFEYAKTAIELGVKNYILKPINQDSLVDTLKRVKKELDDENSKGSIKEEESRFSTLSDQDLIIASIKKYILDNCYRDISLLSISHDFNYNPAYLGRLFSKLNGTSFRDYLNQCRVQKAVDMISEGKYKIFEISEMVGYRDLNYFCNIFKEITGSTPSEYKAKKQNST